MSSRRRLRRDEEGVSEVVGFLFGFVMSFLVLTSSLYVFSTVRGYAEFAAARDELADVANRVLLGVQETLQVAEERNETVGKTDSNKLRFDTHLDVPQQIQGYSYTLTLTSSSVTASIPALGHTQSFPTLNAGLGLPSTPASCTTTHPICEITGTGTASDGDLLLTLFFDSTVTPVVSRITLS